MRRQLLKQALPALVLLAAVPALAVPAAAQTPAAPTYQQPPQPIAQILDSKPNPTASLSPDRKTLLLQDRSNLPSIAVSHDCYKVKNGDLLPQARHVQALPTATALLRLAPALLAAGGAVPASEALPRYIRDKVANTTAEREALRAQANLAASTQPNPPAP